MRVLQPRGSKLEDEYLGYGLQIRCTEVII